MKLPWYMKMDKQNLKGSLDENGNLYWTVTLNKWWVRWQYVKQAFIYLRPSICWYTFLLVFILGLILATIYFEQALIQYGLFKCLFACGFWLVIELVLSRLSRPAKLK